MSLLEKACRTYDLQSGNIGICSEEKEPLVPISHIIQNAKIEITIDRDGNFSGAVSFAKPKPTIIPATMESAGRTSSAKECPHPLSDQLMFLAPGLGGNHEKYKKQLSEWERSEYSHPKLSAVLHYVQSGSILSDLADHGVLTLTPDGKPEKEECLKYLVRWVVLNTGTYDEAWRDRELLDSYIHWYGQKLSNGTYGICGITWRHDMLTDTHAKGILAYAYGAKLISSNDSSEFTYRGRFCRPEEAATIGYTASQKAHNALRWLVSTQGVRVGKRTFLWWKLSEGESQSGIDVLLGMAKRNEEDFLNFRKQLRETLSGYRNHTSVDDTVVIASLEAATTGRLSVPYYSELGAGDFAERVQRWYDIMTYDSRGHTPTLRQLAEFAFGNERTGKMNVDEDVLAATVQRLLQCVIDCAPLPKDIVFALVHKFSRPLAFVERYNLNMMQNLAFTAVKSYRNQLFKEEWNLGLDTTCTDRSYLFGRLLAIAENLENDTYGKDDRRTANALRYQFAFSQHPMSTWKTLYEKLTPYKERLRKNRPGRLSDYEKLIGEISDLIQWDDPNLNTGLSELYVLGYYHQRQALYTKYSGVTKENDNENEGE